VAGAAESRAGEMESITRLMQLAIANGQRELDLNAQHGRRLSPRDDVERAIKRDPMVRMLPPKLRDEIFRVLVEYELVQLHGDRFR
jgi:hypothetical protein